MDMKDTSPLDISSYILFEATGDSEADCNPTMGDEHAYQIDRADDDDDDAQSCSCDGSETCNEYESWNIADDERDDDDDEKKKGDVSGTSYCEDDEMQEHQKSCVSVESGQETSVDEMEKNRRFWEACLAS